MENIQSIKDSVINLINNSLSGNVVDIKMLPASGSSRIYFRIFTESKSFIATYNSNVEENIAFFEYTRQFQERKLPVPELFAISDDKCCYIQSDFGDVSLFDYVKKCLKNNSYDEETLNLYKQSIDNLVDFQVKGSLGNDFDYSSAYPTSVFDKDSIMSDLNYFKYYFLKVNEEINFNETRLNEDFKRLANYALRAYPGFMYRDFQSRNIMVKDGRTYFIDYQGGRIGPFQYDIVSLLYQVKAQLNETQRNELLQHYKDKLSLHLNIEDIGFDKYYDKNKQLVDNYKDTYPELMSTKNKVKELISKQLNRAVDEITEDKEVVKDLGADSLDLVDLVMTVEDEFSIELPDEALEGMKTIGDLVKYIEEN